MKYTHVLLLKHLIFNLTVTAYFSANKKRNSHNLYAVKIMLIY